MDLSSKSEGWFGEWTARWDAMQDAYVPRRREAFALIADLVVEQFPERCRIVDLGAGAGTLAETIVNRHPNASVVCLDVEPFLLEAARRRLRPFGERARVVSVDFRQERSLAELAEPAEAVVSSTTTHWFGEERLGATYTWAAGVLVDGGQCMIFDHIPPDDGTLARVALDMNEGEITCRFQQGGAQTWEEFWEGLGEAVDAPDYAGTVAASAWGVQDGPEAGHTVAVHRRLLQAAGFRHVAVMWRYLNDALLVARR
ncbi:MAG: class I SAM-dependent methyltransferase [Verrucomicrobia bacterium]|nr:class I SAM-dependent methyltransferase [Verrucomicrobiota bacterium]